ncbi:MAG: nuclear transport factor 2 family protein [Solirubrobacterales bacterium]
MSQENVEIVRRLVDAYNEGGFGNQNVLGFFDPEVVFEEPPEQPGPGTGRGREESARMFSAFDDAWEEHRVVAEEIRAIDSERVLVVATNHFRGRDGIEIDQPGWTLFTLRGGKVVLMQAFWQRRNALEAAGLSD